MRIPFVTTLIAAAALFAAYVFVSTIADAVWYASEREVELPRIEVERPSLPIDHPVRLRIPELHIDTHVQEVGVNEQGNMASPSNFTDVGWYKHGTVPGFIGSAVIAGHVDNALALDGVFKDLDTLTVGDDIYVEKEDGTELHFRVTEIERYRYDEVPLQRLFSRKDAARLNLVTCGGTWLPEVRSYDERLVLYTELVSD